MLTLTLLAGCGCGSVPPRWVDLETVFLDGAPLTLDLADFVVDDTYELVFEVDFPEGLVAEIDGSVLTITPESDFRGEATLDLTVLDDCGTPVTAPLVVSADAPPTGPQASCETVFTYTAIGNPDHVAVAGSFNAWSTEADRLAPQGDGTWTLAMGLEPGPYPYKFVEITDGAFEPTEGWSCDPNASFITCDPGYKEPWDTSWSHSCGPGVDSCNSMRIVTRCAQPTLEVELVDAPNEAGTLRVEVRATPGASPLASGIALLDGVPIEGAFDGERFVIESAVDAGRHTLRFTVTDVEGLSSEEAYVPVWTDGVDPDAGVLYFAFVDRIADGDASLNTSEGATAIEGGYEGGDVQGLIEMLPYLDDLGVTVLWLSNLQSNTEGAWAGNCGQTYAGYHAYWPDSGREPEEHFGSSATIHALVDQAHDRGMRVVMDWVANHVHETHPYAAEHPEWFNDDGLCTDGVDGQSNWDRIPESCAFAPYLPDIDYSQPEAMTAMLDDALWWATTYELDGFRVDAVKHMPHSVVYNLQSFVGQRFEHPGSTTDFYTIGETFDSYDQIAAYIGDDQLDGQFDFDLYHAVRTAFLRPDDAELGALYGSYETSRSVYGTAPMSTFLGNHDVLRFVSEGAEGFVGACQDGQISPAPVPTDPWATQGLRLGFTFLFTMPGRPLIYYGDELGLPGRGDPDNRQPMWWHTGPHQGIDSVSAMADRLEPEQAATVRHVAALAQARKVHPALFAGTWTEWWTEYDLFAAARTSGDDHALVVINRSSSDRVLSNGVGFADLPQGSYTDILTGQTFATAGDTLTVDVPARGSRVLVLGGAL